MPAAHAWGAAVLCPNCWAVIPVGEAFIWMGAARLFACPRCQCQRTMRSMPPPDPRAVASPVEGATKR